MSGDVDCDTAFRTFSGYDLQGGKVQQIDDFVCASGNAMSRPTIVTCVAEGSGAEFYVDEE